MADPIDVTLVPKTDPLAKGSSTTEGKAALYALVLTTLGAVVPPLWDALSNLSAVFPQVHFIVAAVSVVGLLGTALVALGYGKQRSTIKAAALTGIAPAAPLVSPIVLTAAPTAAPGATP